jgi:ABC-type phosphate transport system permease subunit
LYFLAAIPALIIGIIVWFLASHWIAASIEWVENRRPDLVGSKQLRVGEAVICGGLVLATFALAFWIMRLLWTQMK